MNNNVMGVYRFKVGGKEYKLHFTWQELDALESEYGASGPPTGNLNELHKIAALGLKRHHPDITAEQIKAENWPPIALQAHVLNALRLSYYGDETPDDVAATAEGDKKKAHLLRRFTRWLFGQASGQKSSGT